MTHPQKAPSLVLAFALALSIIFPTFAAAVVQNTTFLPLKINSPGEQKELISQVDSGLENALFPASFSMMSRDEAAKLVDYSGTWPPSPTALKKIAKSTGLDYVAAGTLTIIGEQISVDYKVFDVLSPATPKYYFLHGESMENIGGTISEIVRDVISYTERDFIIASIAPAGNKRIDSGAISRKVKTKAGDFYDPAALRQDLKAIFKWAILKMYV